MTGRGIGIGKGKAGKVKNKTISSSTFALFFLRRGT